MRILVCEECGSDDVETKMWVNHKTGNKGSVSDGEAEDNYCNGCCDNTILIEKDKE